MRKTIENIELTKDFIGYGHYQLNIELNDGRKMSAITGDVELISDIDSLIDSEREMAKKKDIEYVLANS